MKKVKTSFALVVLTAAMMAQGAKKIPLLGEEAPNFIGESTQGAIAFPEDFGNHWKLILSHPRDFTPVCTSELLELAYLQEDFSKLGVEIIVVSTDPLDKHRLWVKAMEELKYKNREPIQIDFPLVDDKSLEISNQYGMLHEQISADRDVRGVFIVGPNNIVRLVQFYPNEVGRNMEEIKRSIIALQTADTDDAFNTPANWTPGDDVILGHYNKEILSDSDVYQVAWFLTLRKF